MLYCTRAARPAVASTTWAEGGGPGRRQGAHLGWVGPQEGRELGEVGQGPGQGESQVEEGEVAELEEVEGGLVGRPVPHHDTLAHSL